VDTEDRESVAGTVFNEPWDSHVWENLLDMANGVPSSTNKPPTPPSQNSGEEIDSATGVLLINQLQLTIF
jgi:hypothetical protein